MSTVREYVEAFMELGESAFLEKFDHPFLLYPDKHGHGGFRSYHTRMADRGESANLAGSGKSLREFMVLAPQRSGKGKIPTKLLVGRSEDRDLSIDHSTVSKRHAFLLKDESGVYKLGDAGSTNGTFLNGQRVETGEPVFIRDGNIVSFGDCDYLFYSPKGFIDILARLGS